MVFAFLTFDFGAGFDELDGAVFLAVEDGKICRAEGARTHALLFGWGVDVGSFGEEEIDGGDTAIASGEVKSSPVFAAVRIAFEIDIGAAFKEKRENSVVTAASGEVNAGEVGWVSTSTSCDARIVRDEELCSFKIAARAGNMKSSATTIFGMLIKSTKSQTQSITMSLASILAPKAKNTFILS